MPNQPANKPSEEELVLRLRSRETAAMSQLYDMYSATLYGVIVQIVKVEGVAEDVMQESFVKIWNSFSMYDEKKGRLFTWMINICRNLAIDKVRSKEYRVTGATDTLGASNKISVTTESFNSEHLDVREMVGKLNPEQKQIIDLMYFEGYTQNQISETFNIPLGTVKTRARSAVKFLARIFKTRA
ncbi:RNA polymerase sigma factor [Pontibacter harenae]|uniref:RNA polymerase sigma factor n=1 Tax=Pontibacter harenae TaxID=2894083 RepID=UPI001E6522F5|nr:sigma-70 family RNA polymerase sigma factor [Pontibacter harenae]MCC9166643.1 sigma-70 family RNA polymerase sigma factor [Pontibacter harenae]